MQLVAGSESNQKFREEIRAVSLETSASGTAVLVVLAVLIRCHSMWRVQSVLKSIARDQAQEDISCLHEILNQTTRGQP